MYDQASLERWLAHVFGLVSIQAQPRDVAAAHRLRASVLQLARARAEGRKLAAEDIETVNALATVAPPVPEMTTDGTLRPAAASATAGLSAIARDAIDLLSGPLGTGSECAPRKIAGCCSSMPRAQEPGAGAPCSGAATLTKVRTHREMKATNTAVT